MADNVEERVLRPYGGDVYLASPDGGTAGKARKFLESCFADVVKKLHHRIQLKKELWKKQSWRNRRFGYFCGKASISQTFPGLIPREVRSVILRETKKPEPRFSTENIWLVTEAKKWIVNHKAIPHITRADPLVVGYHTKAKEFYLLASFDLEPVEDYVRREFAT